MFSKKDMEMIKKVLSTISWLMASTNVSVVKKVINVATHIYPAFLAVSSKYMHLFVVYNLHFYLVVCKIAQSRYRRSFMLGRICNFERKNNAKYGFRK
jgi:hypothetical protein